MRRARLIPLFVCAALSAAPLHAQWQLTADAGVSHLRQAGLGEASALTLGANLDVLGDRTALQTGFLAARTSADRWTTQGFAAGALRGAQGRAGRLDLTGFLSSFAATSERPTVSSEVMAQARHGGSEAGGAVGLGGGVFSSNGGVAPLLHLQADAWRNVRANQLLGEASLVRTQLTAVPVPTRGSRLVPLSYADFSGSWRRDFAGLTLGALAGMRTGIDGIARVDGWATAEATAWITPRSAIVAGLGRTLEDVVRGAPRTRFVSVALRFAVRPQPSLTTRRGAVAGVVVAVEPSSDGRQRIEVRGAAGSRVEVMGDFTNWNAVALERNGGVWRTEWVVSPGLHRIALRIDDGVWIAPANLPRVTDDLGGVVGLITIP
ncbi:MAG: hypothetical protein JWM41_4574 [Gemmatimonadetes bacterium]|nr:hypothetical protein [Gemmatimonadota bacterium]